MKKILVLIFTVTTVQLFAQPARQSVQLTSYNFANDGFNISAGFPGRPSKDFSNSSNSQMLTLTDTKAGVTYALILTNTASNSIASQSAANTVQKLWMEASQRDVQQSSTIAGSSSTYLKYVSAKGTYISSHTFSSGVMMCQAMVLQKNNYVNDYSANYFFSSLSFGNYSNGNNNQTYSPGTYNVTYKKYEKVDVYNRNDGKWYPGKIRKINPNGTYEINYDEYKRGYEDEVGADRIRRLNNNPGTYNNNTNNNNNEPVIIGSYEKNQRVEVWDAKYNKWYGAIVLKVNYDKSYRVSFDGYAENYDEDVKADRIRNMTTTTASANLPYIKLRKFGKTTVEGNLSSGHIMQDLSWATTSQMACWPSIRDIEFEGKHVGYWFDLPEKSVAKITVAPKYTNRRINIYGYAGFDLKTTPPALVYTNICEASHPVWIGQPNLNEPAKPQTITFNTTTRRTTIYFAVAGARNVLDGDYTISIDID
ncbi:MAG: hypothetical protein IPL84_16075 [Chitinophagaceae bacterium]|nr:hypothetical protein [Chitinophagaceae bacterium]